MPVFRDRVRDTSTTTGTGPLTLSGTAPVRHQTFANAVPISTPFLYCIEGTTNSLWETGTGWLSAATTMQRDTNVFDGSSGPGVLVNLTADTYNVFITVLSHWCEDVDTGSVLAREKGWAMP
jgi:hypothetical protein